jgi:phosphatidylserine/phosphatidylglycerophosphate/cardiolipin synthase-like enzyme
MKGIRKFILVFAILIAACGIKYQILPKESSFDVGFSPSYNAMDLVLRAIVNARRSILIAAYSFTNKDIADALVMTHLDNKVEIYIIADHTNKNNPLFNYLKNSGIHIRFDHHHKIFHHKFMIIDDHHVETGSFNYTNAAVHKNAENVIILWNVRELAQIYKKEWLRLWEENNAQK